MQEYEAGIIRTEYCGENIYVIHLACKEIAREAVPGQFVQVKVGNSTDPFLRRTFSLYGVNRERGLVKLVIDVIGRGTEQITAVKRGQCLNIIGPLGKGFDRNINTSKPVVLVAGGIGVAPLLFLTESLQTSGHRQLFFFMGARTESAHNSFKELFPLKLEVYHSSDDGSVGYSGYISDLLEEKLDSIKPGVIYACGPHLMMKAVATIADKFGILCQVSLEERMACGLGACYGCAVRLRDGRMVRSCVDGPVFYAKEVKW
ncbi:MAG: dihydroorotate dehydrogenase electron transfer subunit [Candidatus Latescibacteria bacterium]|nr:dihydroorotate dehydrogenase electron transfer subunit [Candidatus Latescibacterota bacterium]